MKKFIIATALACLSISASADEAEARKAVELRAGKVDKIAKSPAAGWWEVITDGRVLYVDDKGMHIFAGSLVDVKSGKNLTAERQEAVVKSMVKTLPLDQAIKQVRGNGKNTLITFEDPNCGYCKLLAKELLKVKDVTVYTFLTPILGEDSYEKSRAIWCADDKTKAWVDWMTAGKAAPEIKGKCDGAVLEKNMLLARKMQVRGTPGMFFANGDFNGGAMTAPEIEKRLAAIGK